MARGGKKGWNRDELKPNGFALAAFLALPGRIRFGAALEQTRMMPVNAAAGTKGNAARIADCYDRTGGAGLWNADGAKVPFANDAS